MVVWFGLVWCNGFFVIIIPTPVLVFDLDFDWGVAIKSTCKLFCTKKEVKKKHFAIGSVSSFSVHTSVLGIRLFDKMRFSLFSNSSVSAENATFVLIG